LQGDGRIVLGGTALARYLAAGPQIGSFTANLNAVASGSNTTLSATNIQDANPNATITQVAFYVDSNGNGVLDPADALLGYGTNANGTWTYSFSTAGWAPGSYTLFARATDSLGVIGDPVALNLQLT
jgi:hypothetical protein